MRKVNKELPLLKKKVLEEFKEIEKGGFVAFDVGVKEK